MRLFIAVALTIVTAQGVSAQVPSRHGVATPPHLTPPEIVTALLQSSDPREQAWGAWYAGRNAMSTLVPLLQRVVAERAAGGSMAARAAFDAAVDALVQLDAEADPAILPTIHERSPAAALILASRAPRKATAFLLDVVQRDEGEAWLAAANLLMDERPQGLAALLLRPLSARIEFQLTDGESETQSGPPIVVITRCGMTLAAPGLPPWTRYTLAPDPQPERVVLATGPTTVYYRRIVWADGWTPAVGSTSYGGPFPDDRIRYLAFLGGLDDREPPLHGFQRRKVRWQGSDHLRQTIDGIRADLADGHARLVGTLVERGVLTIDEAQALPPLPVELAITDARRRKR
jgi:hypothetical protein